MTAATQPQATNTANTTAVLALTKRGKTVDDTWNSCKATTQWMRQSEH